MKKEETATAYPSDAPAVSVIVPVCNVEDYLAQCLNSLHAQTLNSLEILLVDDGSTDMSPRMLARAAAKDPRMRVITKENGGYGSAVNTGLAQARGHYIGIVEADDFIDPHMYDDLYSASSLSNGGRADIVKSAYWEYYDLPGEQPYLKKSNLMKNMPKRSFVGKMPQDYKIFYYHPSIWSAIYQRDFLEKKQIRMLEIPGGGWTDNPFLYETFLQAKKYVWLPSAYYYYRKTNPNSSTNISDYHLPFDRLRDIRALYERLEIKDPQLIACMYHRHFYYINSVIGDRGFHEISSDLQSLIREALESMNPQILYGHNKGINKGNLAYYESVMGDPAHRIKPHSALSKKPQASVIVPVCNDRYMLAETLNDLASQTLEAIEIICVDCASEDTGGDIIRSFAKKDLRFRCIFLDKAGYAAGLQAGMEAASGTITAIIMPGQIVPKKYLEHTAKSLKDRTDMCITLHEELRSWCPVTESGIFRTEGLEAELLLLASENLSGCAFRRKFLKKSGVTVRADDRTGQIFLLEAVASASTAYVRFGGAPTESAYKKNSAQKAPLDIFTRYSENRYMLDTAYGIALLHREPAQRAYRCLAVRCLLDDLNEFLYSEEDTESIFDDIRTVFHTRYDILKAPRTSYCNIDEFLELEQLLYAPYRQVLKYKTAELRRDLQDIHAKRTKLHQSASYKFGMSVLKTGKSVIRPLLPMNSAKS